MRVLWLVRDTDVTGISGTGIVAEVVEFSDGTVVMRWLPSGTARPDHVKPTTVLHESLESVIGLHGHDGKTYLQEAMPLQMPPADEGHIAAPRRDLDPGGMPRNVVSSPYDQGIVG